MQSFAEFESQERRDKLKIYPKRIDGLVAAIDAALDILGRLPQATRECNFTKTRAVQTIFATIARQERFASEVSKVQLGGIKTYVQKRSNSYKEMRDFQWRKIISGWITWDSADKAKILKGCYSTCWALRTLIHGVNLEGAQQDH